MKTENGYYILDDEAIQSHKNSRPPKVFTAIITFGILFSGALIILAIYGFLYIVLSIL
jgi:hypothetical protein